jgi:hypothetical protein
MFFEQKFEPAIRGLIVVAANIAATALGRLACWDSIGIGSSFFQAHLNSPKLSTGSVQ